jgi:hypothetical protein
VIRDPLTGEEIPFEEVMRKTAASMLRHGYTADRARGDAAREEEGPHRAENMAFLLAVAAEMDIIEARRRFRVLPGDRRLTIPPDGRRSDLSVVR